MCQCWAKILCAVVVLISVNSVTCVPSKNTFTNFLDFGFTRNKADTFEKCILDANYTCLEELVRSKVDNLLDSEEFEIMEDVVIEKVADSQNEKSSNSRFGKKSGLYRKVKNFFTSRALRVDFLDLFRMRMAKADNFPEDVELSVELVPESGRTKLTGKGGKGRRTAKIIVPLVIGFITTGLGILAIATVKAILMKAFFVSTIAAFTAIFLVLRKMLSSHSTVTTSPVQQPYYYAPYSIPYDTAYHPAEMSFGTAYNALNHYATINPTEHQWAAQYAAVDNGYAVTEHDSSSSAGLQGTYEDPQGQYANVRSATVQSSPTKLKRKSGTPGAFRGMIKLVKSQANRLPVLAYRHTGTGRKLE